MNITQLTKAIKYIPTRKSIMLKGYHGVGKTEWVTSLAKDLGLKLVIWHASHAADAGDITGLPFKITETDTETGETYEVTKFAKPSWMIQKQPVLLLLDEINRGLSIALNAIMQLTNNGTYDDITLPEGSRIFACINPDEHGYDVSTMDPAQLDRFAIYDFKPTVKEWIEWAIKKGLDSRVIQFISNNENMLDPYENQELVKSVAGKDCGILPSRRSWECVSDTIKAGDEDHAWDGTEGISLLTDTVQGIIGTGAAMEFMSFFKNANVMLSPKQVLESPEGLSDTDLKNLKKMSKTDFPAVCRLANSCVVYLKERENDIMSAHGKLMAHNFLTFLKNIEKDARVAIIKDTILEGIKSSQKWVLDLSKQERELSAIYKDALIAKDI